MSYGDQRNMLVVDDMGNPVEYDMYTGQPEYYEPLQDQQLRFEPAPAEWTAQSSATVAGQLDEDNHLQMEDMYGVQTRYFDISMNASLSECAKNGNNAVWKMNPELMQFMKQTITNKNRSNASNDDRAGNVERITPLAATIVEVCNEHDVPIGINIPGFVPNTFTKNGRFLWTIQARTPPTAVNHKVFEPDNFLTRSMYENWRKCDIDQLNREIKFSEDDPQAARMRTDGLAYEVLIDAVMDGRFGNSLNAEAIRDAANYSRWVEIDRNVAQQVHDSIAAPLRDIENRFVNIKDFHARFTRADGRPFDSPHGLIGSPINGVSQGFMDTHFRYTSKPASIRLKFEYIAHE